MYRKIVCLLTFLFPLLGCQPSSYSLYSNLPVDSLPNESIIPFLLWDDLFSIQGTYFVYVFSYTCLYCNMIHDDMINFAYNACNPVYFVEFNEDIPVGKDVEKTIGLESIENLFIKGTPTLIMVEENKIKLNIGGVNNILETIVLYSN